MTEQTNQGGNSQQASDQSSLNTGNQSQSGQQRQEVQKGASQTGQDQSGQQANNAVLPQRPAYVLEAEWDSATGKVRDDIFSKRVNDLSAFKAEQDVRKQSLPNAPDKYEIKNTPNFKAPEGVKFDWDMNDPGLKAAREIAHARGLDQETFSSLLDVYAANKIGESQKVGVAKTAELSKLGSAGPQRIDAVETWLKAKVGAKADGLVAQMKNYPVAAMVESFEEIIRQFSGQGGAEFTQSGRQQQEQAVKVPVFDGSNFAAVRAAQDAIAQSQRTASGGR